MRFNFHGTEGLAAVLIEAPEKLKALETHVVDIAAENIQRKVQRVAYKGDYDECNHVPSHRAELVEHLRHYRAEISELLDNDIVLRHNYYEGVIEHNLVSDSTVMKAVELLRDGERYRRILREQDTERN